MRTVRNFYVIVMVLVVFGLVLGAIAEVQAFGIDIGGFTMGGYLQRGTFLRVVFYISMTIGVIWLCLYGLRLRGIVASIVELLKNGKSNRIEPKRFFPGVPGFAIPELAQLCQAINELTEKDSESISEFEKRLNDLHTRIQLVQKQKRNTEAIIYSIQDAVIVVDEFDRLLMANEAAGRLFDFDWKSAQHEHLNELIVGEKSEFVDLLCSSRQSRVQYKKKEIQFSVDGREKFFDCIVSCVHDEAEHVCGVAAVLHDVTREKEISQMKNDFVNHVSHELKTPLASITAYSEMLADGEAKDEQTKKEFYSVIQSQANRLNRLIEDVLNISRIESGLVKVEKTPVSLTILIEEQMQMIKKYADEKNIEVSGQKPIVFDQVNVDRDMISQVIVNLLSNAVKYTPSGGSVEIMTEVDENERLVRFTVTDNGVGIPPEELKHVFDKFYRVGRNKKQAKGTGLGLSLVKQIVEKVHNGRVFVTSKPGVGSTFGFELPLVASRVFESV
ncbi:ATP-binding protein [Planctomycetota bacterium]